MKTIKNIILILLVGVLSAGIFYSCTYRLDVNTSEAEPRLVIYGYITTEAKAHYVHIHRSTGYFVTTRPQGVSNAQVSISTDDASFELHESSTEPGLYLTNENVQGIEGKTYTLTALVDFDETGIKEQYTATAYLPYKPRVDSIDVRPSKALTDHIEVVLWGRIPDNERNYLSFHVYQNDKLLNDSLINFAIVDDEYIDKKEMIAVPCMLLDQEEDRYKLTDGDNITLRVDAFTKEYGTFLENAQREVQGSVPIFSGPPANVETNIKPTNNNNKTPISGFFSAYGGDWKSKIYVAEKK